MAKKGEHLSEETKRKLSEGRKGNQWGKGHKVSEDHKQKLREQRKGEKGSNWKGGMFSYYHSEAKKLFGKPYCEECGITREEYAQTHKRKTLEMHCIMKDFRVLEQWNWRCVCSKCHNTKFHGYIYENLKCLKNCSCGRHGR